MKKDKAIPDLIHKAIDKLKTSFGGVDVILISDEIIRTKPDEYAPLGRLGVNIEIEGVKTFLHYETAESIMYNPFFQRIVDELVFTTIKDLNKDKF
jgi:hypothetical protein